MFVAVLFSPLQAPGSYGDDEMLSSEPKKLASFAVAAERPCCTCPSVMM